MATSTFSLFFPPLPSSKGQWPPAEEAAYSYDEHSTVTTLSPSSPASSASSGSLVDCTLSLGTPSTRQPELDRAKHGALPQAYPSVSAGAEPCYYHQQHGRGGAAGHEQLLDRRCANCGTASTPLWRNGPRGPKVHTRALGHAYAFSLCHRLILHSIDLVSLYRSRSRCATRAASGSRRRSAARRRPMPAAGAATSRSGRTRRPLAPCRTWRRRFLTPAPSTRRSWRGG